MKSVRTIIVTAALLFGFAGYSSAMCFYNKTNEEIHVTYHEPREGYTVAHSWNIGPHDKACTQGHEILFNVNDGYWPVGKCYTPSKCGGEYRVPGHGWVSYCGKECYVIYNADGSVKSSGRELCSCH